MIYNHMISKLYHLDLIAGLFPFLIPSTVLIWLNDQIFAAHKIIIKY